MEAKLFKKTVTENFKQIRESKGLSTAAIAKILGVSQAKISYIENNKGVLSAADIAILSRRLNVPITEFFRGLADTNRTESQELTHHLSRFGAVLLAKTKGIILEDISFEEIFVRTLAYVEDDRLHQGFLAAFINQSGTQEIHIDQIFARVGSSPFLVTKIIEEVKLALRITKKLKIDQKFPWPRVQSQLNKILETAQEISKTARWDIKQSVNLNSMDNQLPELIHFVGECLNAKK